MKVALSLWRGSVPVRESLSEIAVRVARSHGVSVGEMKTPGKGRAPVQAARLEAYFWMVDQGYLSKEVAHYFGRVPSAVDMGVAAYAQRTGEQLDVPRRRGPPKQIKPARDPKARSHRKVGSRRGAPPKYGETPLELITTLVARKHGVSVDLVVGPEKTAQAVAARDEVVALARPDGWSLPLIGQFLGGRDSSTILAAERRAS